LKRWVPDNGALTPAIVSFAKRLVQRLDATGPSESAATGGGATQQNIPPTDVKMEEDASTSPEPTPAASTATSAIVEGGEIVGGLERPTTDLQVVQHVELLLALSVKEPDLLDT
jgi:symplekin